MDAISGKTSSQTLILLMTFVSITGFIFNANTLSKNMRRASLAEDLRTAQEEKKMMLVDAVLAGRVFETSVNKLPVLSDLFQKYEKTQKYFIPGLNMTDYDESCKILYEDSFSGDFDKEFYRMKEYQYKVRDRNRTDVKINVCDLKAQFGCCTACLVEDCCACRLDGKKDIMKDVLEPNKDVPLKLGSKINLGFTLQDSEEAQPLNVKYKEVITKLGSGGSELSARYYALSKAFTYLPPGGFFLWHTNEHDNNVVPYRMYIISVDEDGQSAFKYQLPNGENHEVKDFHGAVRLFKNTFDDPKTGEEKYLWHSVYSNTHRQSLGFEIRPNEIVALLDSCDRCWDDLRKQYKEIYKEAYR
jgi:hypothetical protein